MKNQEANEGAYPLTELPGRIAKTFQSASEKRAFPRISGKFLYAAGTVGIVVGTTAFVVGGGGLAVASAFGCASLSTAGKVAAASILTSMASGGIVSRLGMRLAGMTNHC